MSRFYLNSRAEHRCSVMEASSSSLKSFHGRQSFVAVCRHNQPTKKSTQRPKNGTKSEKNDGWMKRKENNLSPSIPSFARFCHNDDDDISYFFFTLYTFLLRRLRRQCPASENPINSQTCRFSAQRIFLSTIFLDLFIYLLL